MAESVATTVGELLVGVILSSSVVALIIEKIHDLFSKKRERYFEISKYKIEIMSKAVPYHNQISFNFIQLYRTLCSDPPDYMLCMFHMCNVLHIRQKIRLLFGDLQLDNLEAEEVIERLFSEIISLIRNKFDNLEYSKLSYLTENNLPYYKFHGNILKNEKDLFDKFVSWLSKEKPGDVIKMGERSDWCAELIMFELNHIYAVWYGDEPKFSKLSPKLRQYLFTEHQDYHNRLLSIETRTMLRRG